jgi:hypothetical protein
VAIAAEPIAGPKAGPFSVTASVGYLSTVFHMTNQPGPAADIKVLGGDSQDTRTGSAYSRPLQVLVTDSHGNPVGGAPVTFTAPASGPSAAFDASATVLTGATGIATGPVLIGNDIPGSFVIIASIQGLASSASFHLDVTPQNTPPLVTLPDPSGQANDYFGISVASLGDEVLVGARGVNNNAGAAYLYNTAGQLLHTFTDPNSQTFDFGSSVALSGNDVLIGAPGAPRSGAAFLYDTSGQLLQTFQTPDPTYSGFGAAVALSGSEVLIGGATRTGAFRFDPTVFGAAYLFNTSGQLLQTFQNQNAPNLLGEGVALSGSNLLLADPVTADLFNSSGQLLETLSDPSAQQYSGLSAAVTSSAGDMLVGANGDNNGQGAAYLFNSSGQLLQTFLDPSNNGQSFGSSLSFAGSEVLVGAQGDYGFQGAAYLFNTAAQVLQTFVDPNGVTGDMFGESVAQSQSLFSTNIVVGAPGVNGNQGAAYLYQDCALARLGPTDQSVPVATSFPTQPGVFVTDASGNPLAGVPVTLTVNNGTSAGPGGGAGAAFADGSVRFTVSSNDHGEALAPPLIANTVAGSYSITAVTGNTSTNFTLTNTAGAPANVSVFAGGSQNTPVGSAYGSRFQVLVTDSFGNPVVGAPVSFAVPEFGASGSFDAGAVAPTSTESVATGGVAPQIIAILIGAKVPSDVVGIATTQVFFANHTPGPFSVTATVPGVSAPATFSLTNTTVPAAIKVIAGSGQKATVNTGFGQRLQARVTDAAGNPVSGITVDFEVPGTGPSGVFAGPSQAVTGANGVVRAPALIAGTAAGTFVVNAWVADVATPAVFTLTNTAGAANAINVVAGSPQSATVGTRYKTALQAQVLDSFNNPVSNQKVTFTIVSTAGGAGGTFIGGKTTVVETTTVQGIATAPTLLAGRLTGPFTVMATVNGVSTPARFSLTNHAAPAHDPAAGPPQSAVVGQAYAGPLTARVRDAYGNPIQGVVVIFSAPGQGPSGSFSGSPTASAVTNAQGVATTSPFTANTKAGSFLVTVSAKGVPSSTIKLTNLPGPAAVLTAVPGYPSMVSKSAVFAGPQIQVTDAYGNLLSGVIVTFTVQSNASSGAGAAFNNHQTTAAAVTSREGVARAPRFHATAGSGVFTIQASVGGISEEIQLTVT